MRAQSYVCLLVCLVTFVATHTIKHVVVLMEENRSFDHLLGFRKGVNGLSGKEFNFINPQWPSDGKVFVQQNASNVARCDPDHSLIATTQKIFGYEAVKKHNLTDPTMCGFVNFEKYRNSKTDYCDVMNSFSVEHVPVMNALADEFLLFDNFFASVPGPTWPNRVFFLAATSGGLTETDNPWFKGQTGVLFPQKTIFDQMTEVGRTWKNYVNDTPWELFMASVAHNPENVVLMDEFFADARSGSLPDFSFINPRAGVNFTTGHGSNDMHPDHDVALGEAFYKDIYEALRASPAWNDTLFIVTFDEHGGFYDHVPTVLNIPSPGDNITSYPDVFDFERLGLRIPTLLISPWIAKGVVESAPPAASKPFPNSQYELTSIMATVRKIFGMESCGPLTKRDAWAATFDHLLNSLTEPRTDCPMHLPDSMPPTLAASDEAQQEMNPLQHHITTVHAHLSGSPAPQFREQRHVSQWLQDAFAVHKSNTMAWKSSKANPVFTARCEPFIGMTPQYVASNWTISYANGPFRTVSVPIFDNATNTTQVWCLDSGNSTTNGSIVGVSLCYPSADPATNSDPHQQWVMSSDATLRPFNAQQLCLTNQCVSNADYVTNVTMTLCEGTLAQHWGYMGPAVGNVGWADEGIIAEGSAIYALVVDHV